MVALLQLECDDKFHRADSIDLRVDSRCVSIDMVINDWTTFVCCNASLLALSARHERLRSTLAVTYAKSN